MLFYTEIRHGRADEFLTSYELAPTEKLGRLVKWFSLEEYNFTNYSSDEVSQLLYYMFTLLENEGVPDGHYIGIPTARNLCCRGEYPKCSVCDRPTVEFTSMTVYEISEETAHNLLAFRYNASEDTLNALALFKEEIPRMLRWATTAFPKRFCIEASSAADAVAKIVDSAQEKKFTFRIGSVYIAFIAETPGECESVKFYLPNRIGIITNETDPTKLVKLFEDVLGRAEKYMTGKSV